jgi:DGQHR domain-containing protein
MITNNFKMAKTSKKRKTTRRKKLTPQEKEQRFQEKEIRTILKNIGFDRLQYIDGKEFIYDGRTSEMDDIFINENIILITEYTIASDPGTHLLKKKVFYDNINNDKRAFIEFLLSEDKLKSFQKYHEENIKDNYSKNQLRVQILYCSKNSVSDEHKNNIENVVFFDYHIVQYFKSLTKVIKRSSKYEFLDFIKISFNDFGSNIKKSSFGNTNKFSGHILPEEKSSFEEGYKIVSFYIDAESLLKRSFVLRQNGWREIENIGHYQRMFEAKKITSMRRYLADKNRVFINNIISTISVEKIKLYDDENNELIVNENGQFVGDNATEVTPTLIEINDECNIIGLIDGQHRTYAYHEGDDSFESKISDLRTIQNLLVTGILFPKNISKQARLKFEANLFLEINSNQTNVRSQLKQEIELMISPFSSIAIGKRILSGLNKSGPLNNLIEQYWYEKGKIKTSSIVSFGLRPLIKIEDVKAQDSIFVIWDNKDKQKLKVKNNSEFDLLEEYIDFSVEKIRDLLIALKINLADEKWKTYSPSTPKGLLTVTFVNGILNVLRLLIENNKINDIEGYKDKLKNIDNYDFKKFKSSQYRKMGQDIYDNYF